MGFKLKLHEVELFAWNRHSEIPVQSIWVEQFAFSKDMSDQHMHGGTVLV